MSDDQMRADFEEAANANNFFTLRTRDGEYINKEVAVAWHFFKIAYQAGRQAEREAMQLKNWDGIRLGTTGNQEGEG